MDDVDGGLLLLRAAGVAVLLDLRAPATQQGQGSQQGQAQDRLPGLPQVLHWGSDPGPLTDDELVALAADLDTGMNRNASDQPPRLSLLPGEPDGWSGRPGLSGHRDGAASFPRFTVLDVTRTDEPGGGTELVIRAADRELGLDLITWVRLEAAGVLRLRHQLTPTAPAPADSTSAGAGLQLADGPSTGPDSPPAADQFPRDHAIVPAVGRRPEVGGYTVDGLVAVLPVPDTATELLDLTGRWCRERSPQRQPFQQGSRVRESRRGRTGHDATLLLAAGTPGFGFRHGQVWAVHAAWSGNHVHYAERLPGGAGPGGDRVLGAGELLLPGEIRLAPGESYRTPWVVFAWSDQGMDGVSSRLHRWLRARPGHPSSPRPLVLNTWEAVYFEHDLDALTELAQQAAAIGVERFVLDDGWFLGRRDDTAGLGDWFVDARVWPDGLRPLADRVRALGLEFGLWVEPEMANPDSELVREHPDWLLAAPGRWPATSRNQLVVDVARPEAFAYLLDRLDRLVGELGVGYLKWDHNRDLQESVHGATGGRPGSAGVHAQTAAVYRLLDELRARHPGLEIESCSSGGARVDLGILERTDRVWASDTNDPIERQPIQRWTTSLIPPELVGAHVGPPVAHTTGRPSDLGFRCVTALFGHAGIEWDLRTCTDEERARLTAWAGLYRELRPLLHSGDVVRADPADPLDQSAWLHGVVAPDRSAAVFGYAQLDTSPSSLGARMLFPGLDPDTVYDLVRRDETGLPRSAQRTMPHWWQAGRLTARGSVLARVGIPAPRLDPGQGFVLHLVAR